MIKKGTVSPETLAKSLSPEAKQVYDRLEDVLSRALSDLNREPLDTGNAIKSVQAILDKALQKLEQTGDPNAILSAGQLLREAADRAGKGTASEVARQLASIYDQAISKHVAPRIIENIDPSQLSTDQWNRLLSEIEDLDLKRAGRGPGGGIISPFLAKVFADPRTRYRIRSYLRDLRTAPHTRETLSRVGGKFVDAKRTFRETSRMGMPSLVFRRPEYRPRTREDVVMLFDVSGSMAHEYAMVAAVAKALSEQGLNVRLWYAEEGAVRAAPRDPLKVLEHFGGGGTNLDAAVKTVLDHENLRHSTFIVYTDLYEGGSWDGFLDGLKQAQSRGAHVSVFVEDCSPEELQPKLRDLQKSGIHYVCDVRSLRSMVDAIKQIKYYIKKAAVIR